MVNVTFSPTGTRTVGITGLTETAAASLLSLLEKFYIPAKADSGLNSVRKALRAQRFPGNTKFGGVKISKLGAGNRHSYSIG